VDIVYTDVTKHIGAIHVINFVLVDVRILNVIETRVHVQMDARTDWLEIIVLKLPLQVKKLFVL
jgi:hypothetical protein